MKHTYTISGMTCNGCVASVTESLSKIKGVSQVDVSLQKGEVEIETEKYIPLQTLKIFLPIKYSIKVKDGHKRDATSQGGDSLPRERENTLEKESKLKQLKPLLLIFAYLFSASFLMHVDDWNTGEAMLDFMGLFYIVFSFFKFLDLKGFPKSFRMYDPLAKVIPAYGWLYPFLELGLGLLFLMRFQVISALIITIVILGITTVGVTKTLLDKKQIRCACLGTALKLPMTEATFIENTIMIVMAVSMLVAKI